VLAIATPASAHLMAPQHSTIRVVDRNVFSVVSVPVSALSGVDDDGDGLLDGTELTRHRAAIVEQLSAGWSLRSGDEVPKIETLDLVAMPPDGATDDRAPHVVMLHHARFAHPVSTLTVSTRLFGNEPTLTIAASHGKSAESMTLAPDRSNWTFFAPLPPAETHRARSAGLAILFVLGVAGVRSTWSRTRTRTFT
jgi:hypothetical protein